MSQQPYIFQGTKIHLLEPCEHAANESQNLVMELPIWRMTPEQQLRTAHDLRCPRAHPIRDHRAAVRVEHEQGGLFVNPRHLPADLLTGYGFTYLTIIERPLDRLVWTWWSGGPGRSLHPFDQDSADVAALWARFYQYALEPEHANHMVRMICGPACLGVPALTQAHYREALRRLHSFNPMSRPWK